MSQAAERRSAVRPKIGIGSRVGYLTVIEPTTQRKGRYTVWRCKCDCGRDMLLDTRYLQRGTITDCGCQTTPGARWTDLTGQRFGRLVVMAPTDQRDTDGSVIWRCQCDCGNEALVSARQMKKGMVKSCGCLGHPPLKDLVGERFGRLTVIDYAGKQHGKHYWRCACDCGGEAVVSQSGLQQGNTKSCGCLKREQTLAMQGLVDGTSVRQLEYYQQNLSPRNTSGHNGVYRNKVTGMWQAQVSFQGKTHSLGAYRSINEAIEARQKADRQISDFLNIYYEEHPEWKPLTPQNDDNRT